MSSCRASSSGAMVVAGFDRLRGVLGEIWRRGCKLRARGRILRVRTLEACFICMKHTAMFTSTLSPVPDFVVAKVLVYSALLSLPEGKA